MSITLSSYQFMISIHALREEGDVSDVLELKTAQLFLSTPSARRATTVTQQPRGTSIFLSTPSARRATLSTNLPSYQNLISIHALREEGDQKSVHLVGSVSVFLSTPSARRATISSHGTQSDLYISIHALREEGDLDFSIMRDDSAIFLSTPSARRATDMDKHECQLCKISIHALREEGDCRPRTLSTIPGYFYPRPPRGGRRGIIGRKARDLRNFYPRPPRGGRRVWTHGTMQTTIFLSTPSARRATWSYGVC